MTKKVNKDSESHFESGWGRVFDEYFPMFFDFEVLKAQRLSKLQKRLNNLQKSMKRFDQVLTDFDRAWSRRDWLNQELTVIGNWLTKTTIAIHRLNIAKYETFVKKEIEMINQKINLHEQPAVKKISYNWQGNPAIEVPMLYKKMLGSCIAMETTLQQFEAVFTGQEVTEPIEWLPASNLLAYFISTLVEKRKIRKDIDQGIWLIASKCFTKSKNLSQKADQYQNNSSGKPRNYQLIDQLF